MADEDLKAELERLKAENERLKTQPTRGVTLKVSEKGGVSVYGLGRFRSRSTKSSGRVYWAWRMTSGHSSRRTTRS